MRLRNPSLLYPVGILFGVADVVTGGALPSDPSYYSSSLEFNYTHPFANFEPNPEHELFRRQTKVPLRILPLGASIMYGVGSTTGNGLRKPLRDALRFDGWEVDMVGTQHAGNFQDWDNEGHPGAILSDMPGYFRNSAGYKANVVILNCGTNDADLTIDIPGVHDRMKTILNDIWASPDMADTCIMLSTLIPTNVAAGIANHSPINQAYRTLVSEFQGSKCIYLADMDPESRSMTYGYSASIISTTLVQPSFNRYMELDTRRDASTLIGLTGSLYHAGGFIGTFFVAFFADRFGRRVGIAVPALLTIISGALLAGSVNMQMFVICRMFAGAAAYMIVSAVPVWMNEVVSPSIRGSLVTFHAAYILLGFAAAAWVGYGFFHYHTINNSQWRAPIAFMCLPPTLLLCCLYWLPESPRWLVIQGKFKEAEQILYKLHPSKEAAYELQQICAQSDLDKTLESSYISLITKSSYRKRVVLALFITISVQFTGPFIINNYGPIIYSGLGFDVDKQFIYQGGWNTLSFGAALLAALVIELVPRQKLIGGGIISCLACLSIEAALVATYATTTESLATPNKSALQAAAAMIFIYIVVFQFTVDGIQYVYLGEIFPTHLRAKGIALGMAGLNLINIIWLQVAPIAFRNIGWRFYLCLFAPGTIMGLIIWVWFPNTKGIPLEEAAALFGDEMNNDHIPGEDPTSFSRFSSGLPYLQPEAEPPLSSNQHTRRRAFWNFSMDDRQCLLDRLSSFRSVIPDWFQLPSRHAISRYIAGYVNGFHDHLPFIHIPTISVITAAPELVLALAAVGAQYCFETTKAVEIFKVAKIIALEQIRRREKHLSLYVTENYNDQPLERSGISSRGITGLCETNGSHKVDESIQTAQALLLLLAMATWGNHKALFREALSVQGILATLIRQDALLTYEPPIDTTWESWVRFEGAKRTKFVIFCFFNFHCIIYNTTPSILSAELNMSLPCWEYEWRASTASTWNDIHQQSRSEPSFQMCLRRLFSKSDPLETIAAYSSLGSYILIHSLIQHIFMVREAHRCQPDSDGSVPVSQVVILEQALKRWQNGWEHNPESSLDPHDPHGPVAFNATALLRMAYIRLSVDIGPARALDTQDPILIARAIYRSPAVKRSRKLTRAALHAAHALSIPVKLGVNLVAQTQIFTWSIQHSLCSLECAFLLSKWLEAVSSPAVQPILSDEEKRLLVFVVNMLKETDFMPCDAESSYHSLSARVVRVWAKLFRGGGTVWDVANIIGKALDHYADMRASTALGAALGEAPVKAPGSVAPLMNALTGSPPLRVPPIGAFLISLLTPKEISPSLALAGVACTGVACATRIVSTVSGLTHLILNALQGIAYTTPSVLASLILATLAGVDRTVDKIAAWFAVKTLTCLMADLAFKASLKASEMPMSTAM
ncbi:hypothetical protein B7463_g10338, partial [Scytalidium lignicola]